MGNKKRQMESLENGRGINYVINEGYKILGNPIVMFDTSYNLLPYVEGINTDDQLWNEITTLSTFSHETVDFFNTENFIMAFAESEVVALLKSDKLKYDRMNGKLFDKDGVQLGDISIVACMKPFEEGDMELVEILCDLLSIELQGSEFYHRIDRVYQESLLDKLIDGEVQANAFDKAKIAEMCGELKANLYVAVVDIMQYEHTLTHLAYFRDLFRNMQPEYRCYIHLNNIMILINTDRKTLSVQRDMGKLKDFFAKNNIYAGISGRFHDLSELRKHYKNAIKALNHGLAGVASKQIFKYDNISNSINGGYIYV